MTKKLIWLFLFLLIPTLASAQGSRFDSQAQKTVQNFLAPIPGALITVCSSAGTGTPCSPITPIYTDAGLTQQIAGSTFTADSNGNFGFYAPPGTYKYSITATGVTGQLYTIVLPINLASNNTLTGSNTFSQQIVSTVASGTAPFSIASTTVVPNLNAALHGGLSAPASAIVGISDTQTLTSKTLTSPTINTPTVTGGTIDAFPFTHAATQTSAATNFGTALSTQTIASSVPSTGPVWIVIEVIQTLAGVGCSASSNTVSVNQIQYTSPSGAVLTFNPNSNLSVTGNGALDSGNNGSGTANFNPTTNIVVKSGSALTYTTTSTLASTGCTTTPQYTIYAKVFF